MALSKEQKIELHKKAKELHWFPVWEYSYNGDEVKEQMYELLCGNDEKEQNPERNI